MAITVGLDFGTHQTKICIENSNDPQRKTYEFISWGDDSLFLPSIIQVNKDYTLMYGRFDLSTCLYAKKRKKREKPQDIKYPPKPEILSKPVEPKYPKEPIKNVVTSGGMILQIPLSKLYGINEEKYEERSISEHKKWVRECQRLKWDYEKRYELWRKFRQERVMGKLSKPRKPVFPPEPSKSIEENYLVADDNDYKIYQLWKKEYDKIDIQYKESLAKYEKEKSEYEAKCEKWRKECRLIEQKYKVENELYENSMEDLPMIFRYFKQATFSYYNWNYELKSELLSVWYLAYLIFDLEERFGTDFSIQMGVPASKKTYSKLKRSATTILIQAYRLVEEVFKNDKEKFLATKLEDLIVLTPTPEYSDDLKSQYGIIILPEAYASLRSVTANRRIPEGLTVMLDIGGGTTDISFFVIEKNLKEREGEPHIYHYNSIPKGLNFFLEYKMDIYSQDLAVKRDLKDVNHMHFLLAQKDYLKDLSTEINELVQWLHRDTMDRGFEKSAFLKAIQHRPILYSGGGSTEQIMRKPVKPFDDVKYMSNTILRIPNLIGREVDNGLIHILATAYGLSIATISDEILISKKEDLFGKFNNNKSIWEEKQEYGLIDY